MAWWASTESAFPGHNDASTRAYVRHLDHVLHVVGPMHVALGLDHVFDQKALDDYVTSMRHAFPVGMGYGTGVKMVRPEQLPSVVEALLKLGYRDEDVRAVLGEDWMRVARSAWNPASVIP